MSRKEKKYFCWLCNLPYDSHTQFEEHQWSMLHHRQLENKKKAKKHFCTVCKKLWPTLAEYGVHLISEHHKRAVRSWSVKQKEADHGPHISGGRLSPGSKRRRSDSGPLRNSSRISSDLLRSKSTHEERQFQSYSANRNEPVVTNRFYERRLMSSFRIPAPHLNILSRSRYRASNFPQDPWYAGDTFSYEYSNGPRNSLAVEDIFSSTLTSSESFVDDTIAREAFFEDDQGFTPNLPRGSYFEVDRPRTDVNQSCLRSSPRDTFGAHWLSGNSASERTDIEKTKHNRASHENHLAYRPQDFYHHHYTSKKKKPSTRKNGPYTQQKKSSARQQGLSARPVESSSRQNRTSNQHNHPSTRPDKSSARKNEPSTRQDNSSTRQTASSAGQRRPIDIRNTTSPRPSEPSTRQNEEPSNTQNETLIRQNETIRGETENSAVPSKPSTRQKPSTTQSDPSTKQSHSPTDQKGCSASHSELSAFQNSPTSTQDKPCKSSSQDKKVAEKSGILCQAAEGIEVVTSALQRDSNTSTDLTIQTAKTCPILKAKISKEREPTSTQDGASHLLEVSHNSSSWSGNGNVTLDQTDVIAASHPSSVSISLLPESLQATGTTLEVHEGILQQETTSLHRASHSSTEAPPTSALDPPMGEAPPALHTNQSSTKLQRDPEGEKTKEQLSQCYADSGAAYPDENVPSSSILAQSSSHVNEKVPTSSKADIDTARLMPLQGNSSPSVCSGAGNLLLPDLVRKHLQRYRASRPNLTSSRVQHHPSQHSNSPLSDLKQVLLHLFERPTSSSRKKLQEAQLRKLFAKASNSSERFRRFGVRLERSDPSDDDMIKLLETLTEEDLELLSKEEDSKEDLKELLSLFEVAEDPSSAESVQSPCQRAKDSTTHLEEPLSVSDDVSLSDVEIVESTQSKIVVSSESEEEELLTLPPPKQSLLGSDNSLHGQVFQLSLKENELSQKLKALRKEQKAVEARIQRDTANVARLKKRKMEMKKQVKALRKDRLKLTKGHSVPTSSSAHLAPLSDPFDLPSRDYQRVTTSLPDGQQCPIPLANKDELSMPRAIGSGGLKTQSPVLFAGNVPISLPIVQRSMFGVENRGIVPDQSINQPSNQAVGPFSIPPSAMGISIQRISEQDVLMLARQEALKKDLPSLGSHSSSGLEFDSAGQTSKSATSVLQCHPSSKAKKFVQGVVMGQGGPVHLDVDSIRQTADAKEVRTGTRSNLEEIPRSTDGSLIGGPQQSNVYGGTPSQIPVRVQGGCSSQIPQVVQPGKPPQVPHEEGGDSCQTFHKGNVEQLTKEGSLCAPTPQVEIQRSAEELIHHQVGSVKVTQATPVRLTDSSADGENSGQKGAWPVGSESGIAVEFKKELLTSQPDSELIQPQIGSAASVKETPPVKKPSSTGGDSGGEQGETSESKSSVQAQIKEKSVSLQLNSESSTVCAPYPVSISRVTPTPAPLEDDNSQKVFQGSSQSSVVVKEEPSEGHPVPMHEGEEDAHGWIGHDESLPDTDASKMDPESQSSREEDSLSSLYQLRCTKGRSGATFVKQYSGKRKRQPSTTRHSTTQPSVAKRQNIVVQDSQGEKTDFDLQRMQPRVFLKSCSISESDIETQAVVNRRNPQSSTEEAGSSQGYSLRSHGKGKKKRVESGSSSGKSQSQKAAPKAKKTAPAPNLTKARVKKSQVKSSQETASKNPNKRSSEASPFSFDNLQKRISEETEVERRQLGVLTSQLITKHVKTVRRYQKLGLSDFYIQIARKGKLASRIEITMLRKEAKRVRELKKQLEETETVTESVETPTVKKPPTTGKR